MGLIAFTDDLGIKWRAWRVETPAARAHLMDATYRDGWIVFEREDGLERRRLAQMPDDFTSLSPKQLAELCATAVPVAIGRAGSTGQMSSVTSPRSDDRATR